MYFSPEYRKYIHSEAWRTRRKRALARAGHRCQVCGRTYWLQVHHISYQNLGNEPDVDLSVLCGECHAIYTWYKRCKRFLAWIGGSFKWLLGNR